ncbi:MAG: 30S ribosome-binding factor RbfA [Desulfobaccales bacterium]|jgi:ribosome-binding factor A
MRRRAPVKRPVRVAELLKETLATILLTKCADPRLLELTLTEVEMTPDLKQARVYYVVRQGADREQVLAALHKALGFIRGEVAKAHILRLMPEFHFLPDETLDRAARLEALLREIGQGEPRGE